MSDNLSIGQWQGFFCYGPEYGSLEGSEAEFRFFVEEFHSGQFAGRIIDWEGIGANGEVAIVKGFLKEDFISFTKQYDKCNVLDEEGNAVLLPDQPGHQVKYEGRFNPLTNAFEGTWEITITVDHTTDKTTGYVSTGTWRMYKQDTIIPI